MSEQKPDGTYPYRPSNGTEGMDFMAKFCDRCKREAVFRDTQEGEDGCPIVTKSMSYNTTEPEFPPEWISDDAVGLVNPRCTAFEEVGK